MLNEEEGRILGVLNGIWHLTQVWYMLEFPLMRFVDDCLLPEERIDDQISFSKAFQTVFAERYAERMGVNNTPIPAECAAKASFVLPERCPDHLAGDLYNFSTLSFAFDVRENRQASSLDIYAARLKDGNIVTIPMISLDGITQPPLQDTLAYYGNNRKHIIAEGKKIVCRNLTGDSGIDTWHLGPDIETLKTNGPGEQMQWCIHTLAVLARIGPLIPSDAIGYLSSILRSYVALASDLMAAAPVLSIEHVDNCSRYTAQILQEAISQQNKQPGKFAYMTSDECNAFSNAISPWKQFLPIPDGHGDARARPDVMLASMTGDGISWMNNPKEFSAAYYSVQSPDEEIMDIHSQQNDTFAFSLLNLAKNLLLEKIDSNRFCHIEECVKTATEIVIQRARFEQAFVSYFAPEILATQV